MKRPYIFFLFIAIALTACTNPGTPQATSSPAVPTVTATPETPTPTPIPMALDVNGTGISIADYQEELLRLNDAQLEVGKTLTEQEARDLIITTLTDELLLSTAAYQAGFVMSEDELQARITSLASEIGSETALNDYLARNHYTPESFQRALARQIAAAWQRDQIASQVPETADQIHARQILLRTQTRIQAAYDELQTGTDFAKVAGWYDPLTAGDLGWFPRGTLTQPAVEEAAFALEVGQYSAIIETEFGYHIIYVAERDANHPLAPDIRRRMQTEAVQAWLDQQRTTSTITILLP
jgi:peptidyl-prolyl cis-trans isomerase C